MSKLKQVLAIALTLCLLAVALTGCNSSSGSGNAEYPTKNITVICPWDAGGGTDAVLRAISSAAEAELGVTLTVENKTGGSGAIGHAAIKDADPDGYTIGMITFELNSLPQQGLIDFTYADYDPLIRVNADAAALTVHADAPYNTVEEFVQYCLDHPGEINIGNSAPGSVWHIGAGLLANETGIDVKHIAFEGAANAVTALAGGHIEAVSVSLAEVKSQLDAGAVKCLGIMDTERSAMYPDIPTFQEQGYDINYATWRGLAVPKGMDEDVKQTLVDAFTKAIESDAFVEQANNLNLNIAYLNPEDFGAFLAENYESVTKTLQETKLLDD